MVESVAADLKDIEAADIPADADIGQAAVACSSSLVDLEGRAGGRSIGHVDGTLAVDRSANTTAQTTHSAERLPWVVVAMPTDHEIGTFASVAFGLDWGSPQQHGHRDSAAHIRVERASRKYRPERPILT